MALKYLGLMKPLNRVYKVGTEGIFGVKWFVSLVIYFSYITLNLHFNHNLLLGVTCADDRERDCVYILLSHSNRN